MYPCSSTYSFLSPTLHKLALMILAPVCDSARSDTSARLMPLRVLAFSTVSVSHCRSLMRFDSRARKLRYNRLLIYRLIIHRSDRSESIAIKRIFLLKRTTSCLNNKKIRYVNTKDRYSLYAHSGGAKNSERLNAERPIFRN